MRTLVLGAAMLCGAACLPYAPYWWVEDARIVSLRLTVVEPGGYSTLLHVPPGQQRATALPLDTAQLEWLVAATEDTDVQPPIWLVCTSPYCIEQYLYEFDDCPEPLPFNVAWPCRLGEGERVRFGLGGAYTLKNNLFFGGISVLAIGSRTPDVPSATCLERYRTVPRAGLEQCLIARYTFMPGPLWAALPFATELGELPPEFLEQEPDTHPDIVGFRVSRERGATRYEILAEPGDTVLVEPGERITVLPQFIRGGAQEYVLLHDPDADGPMPPEPSRALEHLTYSAQITAIVDQFERPTHFAPDDEIQWVVSDHPEPATLFVDAYDGRAGRSLAALHFDSKSP